jgi:ABC-type branched-subunit amino acid transport system substrate-binding protein
MGRPTIVVRSVGLLAALAVFSSACSSSRLPGSEELAQKPAGSDQPTDSAVDGAPLPGPEAVDTGAPPPPGEAPLTPAGGPTPSSGGQARPDSAVAKGGSGTSTVGGQGGTAQPIQEANLYSGADNTVGITKDLIRLCAHSALTFAQAFDIRPEDLNVYWQNVSAQGGIYGRKVEVTYEDDAYRPDQAVTAAETCKSKQIFFLLGGIGFDQIPAVRTWAEANKMLYFHHMAVEAGLKGKRYSFSGLPSVDDTGRAFGEYISTKFKGKKVGIIWRRSENWEPGYRGGKAILDKAGIQVVADLPVSQNQAVYTQELVRLRDSGAEIVWVWENALAAAEIIQQAKNQAYRPAKWVVFPFQTTLDVVGNEPIDGVAAWSAFTPGGYGNDFAEFGYKDEIGRFEAAYAKFRPGVRTNDILWQVWVANKAIHDMLERCGPACTRNRLAGIMLSGLKVTVPPNCPVDYTRPDSFDGHLGGHHFFTMESFGKGGSAAFRTTRWCSEHLT